MTETKEVLLLCPTCKKEVIEHHKDDVQTWYICESGHQTANPVRKELDDLAIFQRAFCGAVEKYAEVMEPLALNPDLEQMFLDDLHKIVSAHDDHVTRANFHTALSMYNIPVNNAVKGESGAGKTYGTLEVIDYFPEEDVHVVGSQSPKVVSHDYGEFMTGQDEPLNREDAPVKPKSRDYDRPEEYEEARQAYKMAKLDWDKKIQNSYYLIKLTGKTFVFLDTISYETFEMFKCTLSHDKPRIAHKYVDDKGNVHTTILEGWPSAIFCSVDKKWLSEFSTRCFTVSPSTAREKIGAGMEITSQKKSYPWEYEKDGKTKAFLKALIREIRETFKKHNLKVVCPFPNMWKLFDSNQIRDMRDYNHFCEILPAYTMLKLFQRPIMVVNGQKWLVSSLEDVKAAKALFDEIAETTKSGTEKRVIDFYENFVRPRVNGVTLDVLVTEYNEVNANGVLSDFEIRKWLKRLNMIGWVNIRKGVQEDKRRDTFYPLKNLPQAKISETNCFSDKQLLLELELQKDFKTWLETSSKKVTVTGYEILNFRDKQPLPLTVEDFVQKTVGVDINKLLLVSETETEPNSEKDAETNCLSKKQPLSLISELCVDVCQNYRNNGDYGCSHPNPESLNEKAVKPLRCPGYKPFNKSLEEFSQ